MRKIVLSVFLSFGLLVLNACAAPAAGPGIRVDEAWARPAPSGANGAVYFRLVNNGDEADRLVDVQYPLAQAAEVHETMQMGDDVMSMQVASAVEIPAGGQVEFAPGGLHVMLVELEQPLVVGDSVRLTLRFEKSGVITLDVPVGEL